MENIYYLYLNFSNKITFQKIFFLGKSTYTIQIWRLDMCYPVCKIQAII